MNGNYRMQRGWLEHPMLGNRAREPFCRAAAWVWLIERANFRDGSTNIRGNTVPIKRGQLVASTRFLADAWGWSEPRVRRVLASFKSAAAIECVTDAGQTVITICNYDKYQFQATSTDAQSDAPPTRERRTTDANKKEGKEGSLEIPPIGGRQNAPARRVIAEHMVEIWKIELGGVLSVPSKLDADRIIHANARFADEFGSDLEKWRGFCQQLRSKPFLIGDNDRSWRADFDWALRPKSILKVMEGKYDRSDANGTAEPQLSLHRAPSGPPPTLEGWEVPMDRTH